MKKSPQRVRFPVQPSKRAIGIECLERRTLLATSLANGTLTVDGTNRPDVIDVAMEVDVAGENWLAVTMNGVKTSFDAALVQAIRINALGKNDVVSIAEDVAIDAFISGGKGHDSIDGGAGVDELHGDAGNDFIAGSDGDDDLYGDKGSDVLYGDQGADSVDGGVGNDECWGGVDDDILHGGQGQDYLNGEDGFDLLDSDGGSDQEEDGLSLDLDVEFSADLTGSTGATGHAELELEQEEDQFEIEFELEIEGATPNSLFDVTVDGVVVGQITTDDSGNGELILSGDSDGAADDAFPETFPEIGVDSLVTVGNELGVILQGTFALDDGDSDGGSDGDSDGACDNGSDGLSDGDSDGDVCDAVPPPAGS